jgi:hypothetical protein
MRSSFPLLMSTFIVALAHGTLPGQVPGIAVDGNVGLGWGLGGPVSEYRKGIAANAVLAIGKGRAVFALSRAWQGPPPHGDTCVWDFETGRCRPLFPSFSSWALLVGMQQEAPNVSIRELIGPAVFIRELIGPAVCHDAGTRVGGLEARFDLGLRLASHLRLLTAVKGALVPRFRGRAYGLGALTLGLRLQSATR